MEIFLRKTVGCRVCVGSCWIEPQDYILGIFRRPRGDENCGSPALSIPSNGC